jgi:hephaestin
MRSRLWLLETLCASLAGWSATPAPGVVHTYYVAADEVDWNYGPSGIDKMMGMDFMGYAKVFVENGPHR